ncbi:MAG: CPBP family intramembrane metalloprotease [Calditrichaeota bacterium]|nr:CPBP family intramembrane metalloprotease [Calditrichota bacterium]
MNKPELQPKEVVSEPPFLTPGRTLILVLCSMLLVFGVGFALAMWIRIKSPNSDLRALVLSAELLLLVPEFIFLKWKKLSFRQAFRLRPVGWPVLAASILLTIGLIPISDAIDRIVQNWLVMPPEMENLIKESFRFNNPVYFWVAFLSATIFAGIFEEILFRGFFQKVWETYFSPAWAITVSAVLFAVVHLNPWWLFQILLLGVLLGYIAYRSDSVIPGIFIHVLNNAIAVVFLKIPDEKLGWYLKGETVRWPWLAGGLILFVVGFRWMMESLKNSMDQRSVKE